MKENTYLSRIVEIQKEQGHKVITTGPYRYIRHPMYAAVIPWILGIPLALGSFYALLPGAAVALIIVLRTHLEDKMLHHELKGYPEYARKVKYRLIPFIW